MTEGQEGTPNRRAERSEPILPSRDLDETRAFYEAIGFRPWFRGGGVNPQYEILSRGHLVVHFYIDRRLEPSSNDVACYLRVTDADDFHQNCVVLNLPSSGVPRLTPPRDEPWGMREFTLVDPSGNLLRIGHDLYDAYVAPEP
jgi:catechol 2,3-dioxygenase-like lactoylglutathione lyase family enzyme